MRFSTQSPDKAHPNMGAADGPTSLRQIPEVTQVFQNVEQAQQKSDHIDEVCDTVRNRGYRFRHFVLQWCRVGSLVPSKTLLLPGVLAKGAGGDHRVRALSLRPLRWKGDLDEHPCWYPTAKAGLETVFCCAYGR